LNPSVHYKRWYEKNKHLILAKKKEERLNNLEEKRKYGREQYIKHREKILAKLRTDEHRKKAAVYSRKYRKAKSEERIKNKVVIDPEVKIKKWKDNQLNSFLLRKYKINLIDFRHLSNLQDGKCKCCGRIPKRRLVVDHCHKTGKIRGLLCHQCNASLGLIGDSICGVKKLLVYLESI